MPLDDSRPTVAKSECPVQIVAFSGPLASWQTPIFGIRAIALPKECKMSQPLDWPGTILFGDSQLRERWNKKHPDSTVFQQK